MMKVLENIRELQSASEIILK